MKLPGWLSRLLGLAVETAVDKIGEAANAPRLRKPPQVHPRHRVVAEPIGKRAELDDSTDTPVDNACAMCGGLVYSPTRGWARPLCHTHYVATGRDSQWHARRRP